MWCPWSAVVSQRKNLWGLKIRVNLQPLPEKALVKFQRLPGFTLQAKHTAAVQKVANLKETLRRQRKIRRTPLDVAKHPNARKGDAIDVIACFNRSVLTCSKCDATGCNIISVQWSDASTKWIQSPLLSWCWAYNWFFHTLFFFNPSHPAELHQNCQTPAWYHVKPTNTPWRQHHQELFTLRCRGLC